MSYAPPIDYSGKGKLDAMVYFTQGALKHFPKEVIDKILKVAVWEDFTPDAISGRRSAIIRLREPVIINGRTIRAIKIKGLCYREEEYGDAGLPDMRFYDGTSTHRPPAQRMIFDERGLLFLSPTPPRRRGVEPVKNAITETDITRRAFYEDMSVGYVLGYGMYNPENFGSTEPGFIVLGIEDPQDRRLKENYMEAICAKLGITRLMLAGRLSRENSFNPTEKKAIK